ncbi:MULTISPECIES: hypothetical protein [Aurantimonas]|uniref:hypothetical protein n=1 Tax=Aurantimonas TaxID=182269 RepID=UPI00351364D9
MAVTVSLCASVPALSANLNSSCEGSGLLDNIELRQLPAVAQPTALRGSLPLPLKLFEIFVEEPVSRPSFVAILVESHDGEDCYILEDIAGEAGGRGEGFGRVLVDQAFSLRNDQEGAEHLFITVYDYAFATGDEVYKPRFVDIRVERREEADSINLSITE